jgi:arylsulfatase
LAIKLPKIFNLRSDPFENADIASILKCQMASGSPFPVPAGALVQQWLKSLVAFPPRQRPEHWGVGDVLEKLEQKRKALETAHGGGVK